MVCAPLQVYIVLSIFTIITYGFNLWSNIKVADIQNPSETVFKIQAKQNSTWGLVVKIVFLILYGYLIHVMCPSMCKHLQECSYMDKAGTDSSLAIYIYMYR